VKVHGGGKPPQPFDRSEKGNREKKKGQKRKGGSTIRGGQSLRIGEYPRMNVRIRAERGGGHGKGWAGRKGKKKEKGVAAETG